jgi:hypothetical protein
MSLSAVDVMGERNTPLEAALDARNARMTAATHGQGSSIRPDVRVLARDSRPRGVSVFYSSRSVRVAGRMKR